MFWSPKHSDTLVIEEHAETFMTAATHSAGPTTEKFVAFEVPDIVGLHLDVPSTNRRALGSPVVWHVTGQEAATYFKVLQYALKDSHKSNSGAGSSKASAN